MTEASTLTIGQVAERTGLSVHALRFYESEGILSRSIDRDSGGRRRYREDDVSWLTLCVVLRASGMPLPEIRRYTQLVRQGTGNERERLELLRRQQERITAQVAELNRSMDVIRFKIGVYEDFLDGVAEHGCEVREGQAQGR